MTRRTNLRAGVASIALLFVVSACGGSTEIDSARAVAIDSSATEATDTGESADSPTIAPIPTAVPAEAPKAPVADDAAQLETPTTPAAAPAATATPVNPADAPEATATPPPAEPTATPTSAPTATPTPTPTVPAPAVPAPTATPTPTPTPTAVVPETVKSAEVDGDTLARPIEVPSLDATIVGEISQGEDDSDNYHLFTPLPRGATNVTGFNVTLNCIEVVRLDSGGLSMTVNGRVSSCAASGTSFSSRYDDDNGTLRVSVDIVPEDGDVYVQYELTVTPIRFVYDIAPEDGDSGSNPVVVDPQKETAQGTVSAPQGDSEDWFTFTLEPEALGPDKPESAEFPVGISCSNVRFADNSSQIVATLFEANGTFVSQTVCSRDMLAQFKSVKFAAGSTYFVQIEMRGTGSASWDWAGSLDE